jgi:hypothetical protein
MMTRDIRTTDAFTACDVCGRTLLRGEKAEVYLNGGARRSVCELCKERAIHEGWVREGTVPAYEDGGSSSERRRSLFGRLRSRRETPAPAQASPTLADDLDGHSWSESRDERHRSELDWAREPRHVRAVPTSLEQKIASAVDFFNSSDHPRTVAGVARSLGAPTVSINPADVRSSLMRVVVSWELCWYRYEVDLSEDHPSVRVSDQGYELDELDPDELEPNAVADDRGALSF